MLPWKLRKRHILPASQNLLSVYFSLAKFQLVSCNLSLPMIWQRTYTHKTAKTVFSHLNACRKCSCSVMKKIANKVLQRTLAIIIFCWFYRYSIPWVSKAFHARFPVLVKSFKVTRVFSHGFAFGLQPKKLLTAHSKKPQVPREGIALKLQKIGLIFLIHVLTCPSLWSIVRGSSFKA